MRTEVVIALLSCAGTVAGAFLGVLASQKLTNFRLKSLEDKVNKHNSIIERTFVLEEKVRAANHRIDELEDEHWHDRDQSKRN